ncbi:unnamed protein product [Caretta caretta]
MEARQSEYPKPSACRNLFGPVNHEELNRDLKKHHKDMEEACQRKWNFDFENHKPLAGRFEWQAVEKGSSPDFYFRPPRPPKVVCKAATHESLDVNGNCPTTTSALGKENDQPRMILLLNLKEPTQQKKRFQKNPPVPVQWSKHPRNPAQEDVKRKLFRFKNMHFLVHQMPWWLMKGGRWIGFKSPPPCKPVDGIQPPGWPNLLSPPKS